MFFPKAMTEIELIVPARDLLAVTQVLSSYGVFHQTDSTLPSGVGSGAANTWQDTAAQYAALERRIQAIAQTLSAEEGDPPSTDHGGMIEVEKLRATVEQIEGEVRQTSDQLTAEKKRLEQFETVLHQLEPVADIDLDIAALRNPRYTHAVLGLIPTANIDRLQTSLARVPNVFLTLRSDTQKPVVWLAGPRSSADVLDRAARSAYLDPLTLPEGYDGTPGKIIESLRRSIEATRRKIDELQDKLARYAREHSNQLRELLWQAHTSRVLSDAIVRYGQLKHTYVVTGWVPVADMESLTSRLKNASREILIETLPTSRHGHNQNVPVALLNNKYLRPFQMLVNTYARPAYGELDPTVLFAFTFPFLYGAMFGDLGQGLVLFVLGLLIHNKIIMKGMSSLGLLIAYCGASAAVFGALYGSVFGFEGEHFEHTFGFPFHPIWLSPIDKSNILQVLVLAIDVGIVMLLAGFLLGIFNHLQSRHWSHFWFGHNGILGLLFYLAFLGMLGSFDVPIIPRIAAGLGALPIPWPILLAGFALGIMFSEVLINLVEGHRPLIEGHGVGGVVMYFVQAFMNVFETFISQLSNTLSYVRVGAFAVAHGGLSLAIFNLAGEELDLGFWITVIIGNIFIIGFEGLIVGIQTMRLHYYEFLGKFFTGGGMRFEPLKITPAKDEA
ncbi:MAG: V-type ATPase 116kDa subunit family protein [Chloroflexota bacterium]